MRPFLRALAVGLGLILPAHVSAQISSFPPMVQTRTSDGVDLKTGAFMPEFVDLSIGSGQGALTLKRQYSSARQSYLGPFGRGTSHDFDFTIQFGKDTAGRDVAVVTTGAKADILDVSSQDRYVSRTDPAVTLSADRGAATATYVLRDGTEVRFRNITEVVRNRHFADRHCSDLECGLAYEIRRPDGRIDVLEYEERIQSTYPTVMLRRLVSISNNYGYTIRLLYQCDGPSTCAPIQGSPSRVRQVTASNVAIGPCQINGPPLATVRTCSEFGWSSAQGGTAVRYSYNLNGGLTDKSKLISTQVQNGQSVQTWSSPDRYAYDATGMTQLVTPLHATTPALRIDYADGRVSGITNRLNAKTNYMTNGAIAEVTSPLGDRTQYAFYDGLRPTSVTDALLRSTQYEYNSSWRVTKSTTPELQSTEYKYDARGNTIEVTRHPKPGSGLSSSVIKAEFPAACVVASRCNKPDWVEDALRNRTTFAYNERGQVTRVQGPPVEAGQASVDYVYAQRSAMANAQLDSTPEPLPPVSVVVETRRATSGGLLVSRFDYDSEAGGGASNWFNLNLTRATKDLAGLNVVNGQRYDSRGDVIETDGPQSGVADLSVIRRDHERRPVLEIGPDPDGGGPLRRPAVKHGFDADGNAVRIDQGVVTQATDADLISLSSEVNQFDLAGRLLRSSKLDRAGATITVVDINHDADGRPTCTAVRMNPAQFSAPRASACAPMLEGEHGPDLVTRRTYDAAGQILAEQTYVGGTPAWQSTAKYAYTRDGALLSLTDARNYVVAFEHDGFNRKSATLYPAASASPTSQPATGERITYDAADRVESVTTRAGVRLSRTYDALGRLRSETSSAGSGWHYPRLFSYGLDSQLLSASTPTRELTFDYDVLGRVRRQSGPGQGFTLTYNGDGDVVGTTYPDGAHARYGLDALGRMTSAHWRGAGGGETLVAQLAYDDAGRRDRVAFGDSSEQFYEWDDADRLTSLRSRFPADPASDVRLRYVHDPAGRLVERGISNAAYAQPPPTPDTAYTTADRLNRYPKVGAASYKYDLNGALIEDTARVVSYDEAGRLMNVEGRSGWSGWVFTPGDALGRAAFRHRTVFGDNDYIADFWRAGDRAEVLYEALVKRPESGPDQAVGRRAFVLGPGADERLAFIDADQVIRYPHVDERGSTIALSEGGRAALKLSYAPFGESTAAISEAAAGATTYPYRYTGQRLDAITGLYDFKARAYRPQIGRFLQPDPSGFGDGSNLYAYAGNDPLNAKDPSGLYVTPVAPIDVWGTPGPTLPPLDDLPSPNPYSPVPIQPQDDPGIRIFDVRQLLAVGLYNGPDIDYEKIGGDLFRFWIFDTSDPLFSLATLLPVAKVGKVAKVACHLHHCTPTQVLERMSESTRRAVQGKKGAPNRLPLEPRFHIYEVHNKGYNKRWIAEWEKAGGVNATPQQIFRIDDALRAEYGLPPRGGK